MGDGGARAYLGCMMPGFPNLWSLYGPNTNGGFVPASFHEMVTRYALQCMERLILEGEQSIERRRRPTGATTPRRRAQRAARSWSDPRAHNYYWTEHGRSAVMCPFAIEEIFALLRHPPFDELEIR